MPTYEYVCEACGHAFDEFQSITAKPLRKCPQCGKSALKRLIGTGAGIIFKGSGFYCTDYRGESYKKAAGNESATSTTKTAEKKDSKTESTAAPAATKTESGSAQKKKSA
ncbi:MAG: zinc ribbon domain-containing protein [Phycisphaerae bacterium]|nr:zinc ribbon domain-containing protein [Phycisphaerae bacterium]